MSSDFNKLRFFCTTCTYRNSRIVRIVTFPIMPLLIWSPLGPFALCVVFQFKFRSEKDLNRMFYITLACWMLLAVKRLSLWCDWSNWINKSINLYDKRISSSLDVGEIIRNHWWRSKCNFCIMRIKLFQFYALCSMYRCLVLQIFMCDTVCVTFT